jgi:hypothetical protein
MKTKKTVLAVKALKTWQEVRLCLETNFRFHLETE